MRFVITLCLLNVAGFGLAQELDNSPIPKLYDKFQGDWIVTEMQSDRSAENKPLDANVTVTGKTFQLSGSSVPKGWCEPVEFFVPEGPNENPFRGLQERGVGNLDDIVDAENQIIVFWYVGVYKWSEDDELQLALKYCGQGVEGKYAKEFRPPFSFMEKRTEGEVRLTLKRKSKKDEHEVKSKS